MKILGSLLIGFLVFININAQEVCENSFLSIKVPSGWFIQKMDLQGINLEGLFFCNSGNTIYNQGYIYGIENLQDPYFTIKNQIETKDNTILENATFGDIHNSSFMGIPAAAADFSTTIDNIPYKGSTYAFNKGECTILVIGCYRVGVKSNLPQIWRSIQWKNHVKINKNENLREMLENFTSDYNNLLKSNAIIKEGEQIISITLEENEDCLVYTYKLVNISISDFSEESIKTFQSIVRPNLINMFKQIASQTELIKRCEEENYVFKCLYFDKDDNFITSIKITPDDYNQ